MTNCLQFQARIALYVDREVTGAEALDLEAHLTECSRCRREYENLRATVDAVSGAAPLYEVPEGSYAAIQKMADQWERKQRRWLPAAAAAAIFLALAAWFSIEKSGYEQFAAQTHRNFTRGTFPLDIASDQPRVVSDWLAPRVAFHLALPDYPEEGPKRYALVGARLMQFRGEDVAYLSYKMDQRPISLLISSSPQLVASEGESYKSGSLMFHFSAEQGLRIITWKDRGLTYAQVSDLNVNGSDSCVICHGKANERPKFEGLTRQ